MLVQDKVGLFAGSHDGEGQLGAEVVAGRVEAGIAFAVSCARAGGFFGVGTVGGELALRDGHEAPFGKEEIGSKLQAPNKGSKEKGSKSDKRGELAWDPLHAMRQTPPIRQRVL